MTPEEFRRWSRRAAEWGADYREGLGDHAVRSSVAPGEIAAQLPASPPESAEEFETIFADFERIVPPGMTHWQHPRFFAYFPASAAPPSVIAEYLVSAMAAQCMLWQTSPAATEIETRMMDWLRQALGLPDDMQGAIQDSASSATTLAALTMREKALNWRGNAEGLSGAPRLRVYGSEQAHSSIARACWIAGIGADNLVLVPTHGPLRGMRPDALDAAVAADRAAGHLPIGIMASVGGTSVGGTDDVAAAADVARRHGLHLHVDAAWAGSAMICPEFRPLWAGIERADSLVLNPHKWLGAQFDCSAYFVREPEALVRTMAARPEYLKTYGHDCVIDYSEWSLPLGRRFRALKLWFLIRAYGLEGLREMIRNHVAWSRDAAKAIAALPGFALTSDPVLSLFSFRHDPGDGRDLDAHNAALVEAINADGRTYLTQTRLDGRTVIRFQVGPFETTRDDVMSAVEAIGDVAARLG